MVKISIEDLRSLLNQQKELVIERLLSETYIYNTDSTDSHTKSMQNIDKDKFKKSGLGAKFPNDFNIIEKYLK